jgi:hypothetical protein
VGGWNPSYLPEFDDPEEAAETAYAGDRYYAQDELVTRRNAEVVRETYGSGTPHRSCEALSARQDQPNTQVRDLSNEWWVPVHFPRSDYLMKVDTGARVNVISVADLSRLGYDMRDLVPSGICLVGFNRVVVQPRGQLQVKVRVNGSSFHTNFHVVDQCNSPLLCLRDAERARLVHIAAAYTPAAVAESKTAPGTY